MRSAGSLGALATPLVGLCLAILAACDAQKKENIAIARQRAMDHRTSPPPSDYVLSPGDVITVKFFYNPELNEQLPIRPDGKTSLQLVGDVQTAGLTVPQFHDQLVERYADVIKHAEVTVIVNSFEQEKIYVGGEVKKPGVIPRTTGLTASQAIIMAGGHTNTSEMRNVVIVRNQGTEEPLLMMVNLQEGLASLDGYQDLPLQARDMVFVPMSGIAQANLIVEQYIEKMIPITTSFNLQYNFGALGIQ